MLDRLGDLSLLSCEDQLWNVLGCLEGFELVCVSDLFQEIRDELVDKVSELLDCVSVRNLVEDPVGWRGLHDLIPKTGELTVGLIANNHTIIIDPLDLVTRHILSALK